MKKIIERTAVFWVTLCMLLFCMPVGVFADLIDTPVPMPSSDGTSVLIIAALLVAAVVIVTVVIIKKLKK
ncbi:MAG: hypothetical protein K5886_01710 [Lachnospiraceae bacterium]|nr:hypothetical protein [Lachnospiraceae bacterium]